MFPLLLRGIHTCGVVCAGVQEDDGASGSGFDGVDHAVEIEGAGLAGEVGVLFGGDVDVAEDLVVVCPGGVAHVDGWGLGGGAVVEFGEEEGADVEGTGAGDGLEGDDALFGDDGGVFAEDEFLGGRGEVGEAGDGEVFVVEVGVFAEEFVGLEKHIYQLTGHVIGVESDAHLLHYGQDPWLAIVVSVCSNAQVDLHFSSVSAVCRHQTEHWVFWCLRNNVLAKRRSACAICGTHLFA